MSEREVEKEEGILLVQSTVLICVTVFICRISKLAESQCVRKRYTDPLEKSRTQQFGRKRKIERNEGGQCLVLGCLYS